MRRATRIEQQALFEGFADIGRVRSHKRRIRIGGRWLRVTPVFDAYWRFATERQRIFFERIRARDGNQCSTDPILSQYKFTNAYRASDRVSQYLIRNVIYRDDLPKEASEVFFRIMLFKLFNKIETWELLERVVGPITLAEYDFRRYDRALSRQLARGDRIYSAAYIMPSCGRVFGHRLKHQNHLKLLEWLIDQRFPHRLIDAPSMSVAFDLMLSAPSIGPFLAYQYVTDLNYSVLTDFGEGTFVVAGPGALDGIAKCFVDLGGLAPEDVIHFMYEQQDEFFAEQRLDFKSLWGRPLQLVDCQNVFCEISKYARVAFPDIPGRSGRTRIKQKYKPHGALPTPWYPPKWRINSRIDHESHLRPLPGSEIASAVQLTML